MWVLILLVGMLGILIVIVRFSVFIIRKRWWVYFVGELDFMLYMLCWVMLSCLVSCCFLGWVKVSVRWLV